MHSLYISFYSYFVYEISHPNKSGVPQVNLVNDPEIQIDIPESLCPSQAAVERIIAKVFCHSHCDVIITERLRSLFLWRMGKGLEGLGGTARKKQFDKWKDSKWIIDLKMRK